MKYDKLALADVIERAKLISRVDQCAMHVNAKVTLTNDLTGIHEITFRVSGWHDDSTVVSFENGNKL